MVFEKGTFHAMCLVCLVWLGCLVWLAGLSVLSGLAVLLAAPILCADGIQDNLADDVRPIPPTGIEVGEADRAELNQGLLQLAELLEQLKTRDDALVRDLLPDVEIFHRAVDQGLKYNEFFAAQDVATAKELLQVGLTRARQLQAGESPWTTQSGLVVRGYVSRLDHTVQPYGLVIPASYQFSGKDRFRLDLWLHGRGERLSENNFLGERMKHVGPVTPADTLVLHPYGRYCNAFKFAGEVDVLEAMQHAKRHYRVDDDRIAVRGFSMGGAGCWQMAVHYPDHFFSANPGAGFSETPEFLKSFQQESLMPTWYEKKLWQWYDCPGYCVNLYNLPTVAYSGELDSQKQAADVMEAALAEEDISLVHLIGPQTKHAIHPDSAREIERRLASLAEQGRDRVPRSVKFATTTLQYNRSHWVRLDGLKQHWEPARIEAGLARAPLVSVRTTNVTGFTLSFPPGWCPFPITRPITVEVNGQKLEGPRPQSDRSWTFHFWNGEARDVAGPPAESLYKRVGLHGPIDHAFMDTFIVVRPTGKATHAAVGDWVATELEHFLTHWRRHFRGDAIVKNDTEVTDDDIGSANLILFGDPASNRLMGEVAPQLPIQWTSDVIRVGEKQFDAAKRVPVLIYPNPLNPQRYVVLNSGFTFREYAYLNNARQVPKLPDWAIVDLTTPANSLWPGKIVDADFFDEQWRLR